MHREHSATIGGTLSSSRVWAALVSKALALQEEDGALAAFPNHAMKPCSEPVFQPWRSISIRPSWAAQFFHSEVQSCRGDGPQDALAPCESPEVTERSRSRSGQWDYNGAGARKCESSRAWHTVLGASLLRGQIWWVDGSRSYLEGEDSFLEPSVPSRISAMNSEISMLLAECCCRKGMFSSCR